MYGDTKMEMDLEVINTEKKIKKEMKHFMALNVMSIAFGGIAMALAISSLTVNALSLLQKADSIHLLNVFSNIGISLVVGVLALWFIISTAEVLSKFEEIQEENNGEKNHAGEKLTTRIIRLMGLYREERPQIKRMILVSKIAGICFLANAFIQTVLLAFNASSGSVALAPAIGGILMSLVMGIVGFFLPFSFRKYSVCWDQRLLKSGDVEAKIASFMEEGL